MNGLNEPMSMHHSKSNPRNSNSEAVHQIKNPRGGKYLSNDNFGSILQNYKIPSNWMPGKIS